MSSKYDRRMARGSYYSKPVSVILALLVLASILLIVAGLFSQGNFSALIIGFVMFAILMIATFRGRQWNRVHVLRTEGQMRVEAAVAEGIKRGMPAQQPVQQQPAQPTVESRFAQIDRMRKSGQISDEEYAEARSRIIGSL
jgi:hypothetical protein